MTTYITCIDWFATRDLKTGILIEKSIPSSAANSHYTYLLSFIRMKLTYNEINHR